MRAPLTVLSIVVALTVTAAAQAQGTAATDPHVRPADAADAAFVADALGRSPTVRDLADRLRKTDVIAYVRTAPSGPGVPESSIQFIGQSRVQRFMVVTVSNAAARDRQIALMGHELQHALDMAQASWVTDARRMQTHFEMTGWKNAGSGSGFETLSAMQVERKVGRELVAGETATGQGSIRPR